MKPVLADGSKSGGVVLASASKVRERLLRAAGLSLQVVPADIDENAIREALKAEDDAISADDLAEVLARTKAQEIAQRRLGRWTIGCDQILEFENRIFEKARNDDEVRANLLELSGKSHSLHSAVVLADGDEIVWTHVDVARVKLRAFTPQFVGRYMAAARDSLRRSVGCYELEGLGIQLIERIEGDYFTVLGLPLYALLDALREREVIDT